MNAPSLTFYTHPFSRGRIVRWMLEECGADYDTVVLTYGDTMKAQDYLAINPMGKVPALAEGDVRITETAAICTWLAERFPEHDLAPQPGSAERGAYLRWLFFVAGPLEAAITHKNLADKPHPGVSGYGSYPQLLAVLEDAVANDAFLNGPQFTAAHLLLAAQLDFGLRFGTIEHNAVFEQWLTPILARPAYQRANGLDDDLGKRYPVSFD